MVNRRRLATVDKPGDEEFLCFIHQTMPHGVFADARTRCQLYYNLVVLQKAAETVHTQMFSGVDTLYTIRSLKNLRRELQKMSGEELQQYLSGPRSRKLAGRKKLYNEGNREELCHLRLQAHTCSLRAIQQMFATYYVPDGGAVPSVSTLSRLYKQGDIVRKVAERRNAYAVEAAGVEFVAAVSPLDPYNLIDIDESLFNRYELQSKYAWSRAGVPAIVRQFALGELQYSVIAAYSAVGFVAWGIYEGTVSAREVEHFTVTHLVGVMSAESLALLDNASVHKPFAVQQCFEDVLLGQYAFVPPYSPHLKPIELGFANVKCYIRQHELEAMLNPLWWINHGFEQYAYNGPRGGAAFGNWSLYFEAHQQYLDQQQHQPPGVQQQQQQPAQPQPG